MPTVFVISAPSGSGKSTLVEKLVSTDGNLSFATSVTTRPRRSEEVEDRDYRFVSRDVFLQMRDQGEFLEWAEVFGHLYGTPREAVEAARAAGRDLLLDIDVQGRASLVKSLPGAVTIFILPPSRSALKQRLEGRRSDAADVIERRLSEAAREVREWESYDHIVVNRHIAESVRRLRAILAAERDRAQPPSRRRPAQEEQEIGPILRSFGIEPERKALA